MDDSEVRLNVTQARSGEDECIELGARSPITPAEASRMAQDLLTACDSAEHLLRVEKQNRTLLS